MFTTSTYLILMSILTCKIDINIKVIAKKKKGARYYPSPMSTKTDIRKIVVAACPLSGYTDPLLKHIRCYAEVGATPTDATCHKVVHNVS